MSNTAPLLTPETESAVRRFMALIVFGSRARGTYRPDSDADVAVLLAGPHRPFLTTKLQLADTAYDVLLDTGINRSVWLIKKHNHFAVFSSKPKPISQKI